MRVPAYVAPP
ncbi:hypothetical protein YPPY94_3598, partial [Yersinia pestis PY-94]